MAIVPVHKRITEETLKKEGFKPAAIGVAAAANAAVDEKQGNAATETNLHAMRGLVEGRLQTEEETRRAVAAVLDRARNDVLAALKTKDYTTALQRLGQALHTAQDGAIHHYEPWPYTGIGNAILKDPLYMAMHGARDLCLSRYVLAGAAALDRGQWGVATEVGVATYMSQSSWWVPDTLGIRGTYQQGGGQRPGITGMLTLCWGACPGTGASPTTSRAARPGPLGAPPTSIALDPTWAYELRIPSAVLQQAEKASSEFVDSVKKAAGAFWGDFVKG